MSREIAVGLAPETATARPRIVSVARKVGVGLAAALVAGVVMGAIARLMMRLAVVAVGEPGSFSLAGTAGIIVVFVVVTAPGAVLASLLRRRGRSALLVLGALLLCVPAVGVAGTDIAALGELRGLEWAGVVLATVGVFASVLALPVVTLRLIRRWS